MLANRLLRFDGEAKRGLFLPEDRVFMKNAQTGYHGRFLGRTDRPLCGWVNAVKILSA